MSIVLQIFGYILGYCTYSCMMLLYFNTNMCCISLISYFMSFLHCALSLAAQCIVIGPICGRVCNGRVGGVCYHDNSKLRASIFTKLGL